MARVPLVYHEKYDLHFGHHVFPTQKYRMIRELLLKTGEVAESDFQVPSPASDEELLRVHQEDWVRKLQKGTMSYQEILQLEVPYSRQMVEGFWLAAGGTTLAGRLALTHGAAYNAGGGFHHAFPDHGEGFCAIHDVAVAIRALQRERLIRKAVVVDVDVHQGNGTAFIFARDKTVFTLSIHQLHNYPAVKPPSDLDINLEDGTGDFEYLDKLRHGLVPVLDLVKPDILFYVAGADPYLEDQLGGLNLTKEGLYARDNLVLSRALQMGIPAVITLAGGYANKVEDTVEIHANTWRAAEESLAATNWPPKHWACEFP